jgi:tetratricopeptide (TPR) repeat protein
LREVSDGAAAAGNPAGSVRAPAQCGAGGEELDLPDVVDVIARRHRNMAARREKAWKWEHWGVVPDLDSQLALAAELGVAEDQVRLGLWPDWLPDGDPVRSSFAWTQVGGLEALADAREHASVDRRGFIKVVGAPLVGLADAWLAVEPAALVAVLGGGRVTIDFVERLEQGVPRLHFLEAAQGGRSARKLIDAELGIVVDVLQRSAYTAAVGKRLYRLAAELGGKAGWASFDAGLHAAAQRYWVAALHAAHAAGDRLLGAKILREMSGQCDYLTRPNEALALARSAYAGARQTMPRAAALLALGEARAHAALGDVVTCEKLIAQSDDLFGRATAADDDPAWLGYFDESEFNGQVGTCYLDLAQPHRADTYFSNTLQLAPATKVRDRAQYVIRRACAQTQLGNADQAAALIADAVPLIREAPSERNVRRVVRARERLPFAKSDPRCQDLDEQLATLAVWDHSNSSGGLPGRL